jgi:hypothetical protein
VQKNNKNKKMQEIKKFWDEGVSFEEYLVAAKHDYENMSDGEDMEMKEYYRLGIQRMERMVSRVSSLMPVKRTCWTRWISKGKY